MIGQTISHYRISEKLGEGGMGAVYKPEDTKLDRPVALKFLASHLLKDEEARERFTREAKAAAALDHPNICTIHEIDEAEGQTFLAMAFIQGHSAQLPLASCSIAYGTQVRQLKCFFTSHSPDLLDHPALPTSPFWRSSSKILKP